MTKKIYLKPELENKYLFLIILYSIMLLVLVIMLFYYSKSQVSEIDSSVYFWLSFAITGALLQAIAFFTKHYYARQAIIEYSDSYLQVNKQSLRHKTQRLKPEEIESEISKKGDIKINLQTRAYKLSKKDISKEDYQDLLSYLKLK